MANADRPCGFRPLGNVRNVATFVAGATIYPGDAVILSSDGMIDPATAGSVILGVALNYAASADTVNVCIDPDQLYLVQADETEIDAQTDVGNVADIVATAGDSTYRQSRMELDSSSIAAGGSKQLLLLGVQSRVDNALGAQVDCIVKINEHQLTTSFAGV